MIKKVPGFSLLQGGWPDDARVVLQTPIFADLLKRERPAGACLNAGAGEGLFADLLNQFHDLTKIVHLDLQKPDLGRWLDDPRNIAAAGSLTALPFGDSTFDFIFCTEVLEHIENDEAALSEIARVLRPNGLLLLSTPTPPAPDDPAHVREGYTLVGLTDKLMRAGFDVIDHRFCFHAAMRALLPMWRCQYNLARQRRSWMPKAVVIGFAYFDRWFPLGKPWDLVVLARKR